MLELPDLKVAFWYTKAVPLKSGTKKLTQICEEEMGIDPTLGGAFLFFNPKKDRLKLFFIDATGSKEITKILPKQGFSFHIYSRNERCIKIDGSELKAFFQSQ